MGHMLWSVLNLNGSNNMPTKFWCIIKFCRNILRHNKIEVIGHLVVLVRFSQIWYLKKPLVMTQNTLGPVQRLFSKYEHSFYNRFLKISWFSFIFGISRKSLDFFGIVIPDLLKKSHGIFRDFYPRSVWKTSWDFSHGI